MTPVEQLGGGDGAKAIGILPSGVEEVSNRSVRRSAAIAP